MESEFVSDNLLGIQTFGILCGGMLMAFLLIIAEYALIARPCVAEL